MALMVPRTMSGMCTYVVVVISPATTAMPVVTSVSQATRAAASLVRMASRIASEIWSAILSGWPSVTDSDVKTWRASNMWMDLPLARQTSGGATPGQPRVGIEQLHVHGFRQRVAENVERQVRGARGQRGDRRRHRLLAAHLTHQPADDRQRRRSDRECFVPEPEQE